MALVLRDEVVYIYPNKTLFAEHLKSKLQHSMKVKQDFSSLCVLRVRSVTQGFSASSTQT